MRRVALVAGTVLAAIGCLVGRAGSDDERGVSYRCRYTEPVPLGVFVSGARGRPALCDPDGTLDPTGAIELTDVVASATCGSRHRVGAWYLSTCVAHVAPTGR